MPYTTLFRSRPSYLAFLGRIAPEKAVDRAIRLSQRTGIPLTIAAKVDRADQEYFEETIRPLPDIPGIASIGEIDDAEKAEFLSGPLAVVVPIGWTDHLGLVMKPQDGR